MKKSDAFGQINAMSGVVKLIDIINIVKSIDNFKEDTLDNLKPVDDYSDGTPLDEIYIDLSYQRKLKLQELINRLLSHNGFDKTAAANAGILTSGASETKARELEANKFELRNGHASKVSAGALFKSQVTGNRKEAIETLEVMKICKLNIEGVNPDVDAYDLGGFAFFLKHYRKYQVRNLLDASNTIRETWKNTKTMSVTLLIGLTHFLTANSELDKRVLTKWEVNRKIKEIIGTGAKQKNQQYFLKPMLKGKTAESVSYNLVEKAFNIKGESDPLYNDNGAEVKEFFSYLGLEDDELDSLERE